MERELDQELLTYSLLQSAKLRNSDWLWSALVSQTIHCRSTTHSSLWGLNLELPSLWIRVVPVGKGKGRTKLLCGAWCTVAFLPLGPGPGSTVSFEVPDQQQTVKAPIYVFIAKRQNQQTLNPLPTLHFLFRRLIYIFPPFLSSSRVCSLWGFSGLPSTSIPTQQALQSPLCAHITCLLRLKAP